MRNIVILKEIDADGGKRHLVSIDGEAREIDLSFLTVRLVKWNGTSGIINAVGMFNAIPITDFSPFQQYVDAWDALTPAVPVPTLGELKVAKRSQIDTWRDAACVVNVSNAVGGITYWWQADARSQGLISNVITLADSSVRPAPPIWRTADNINVPITLTDIKNIAAVIANQTDLAYVHSWALKAQANAATTEDQLNAIALW